MEESTSPEPESRPTRSRVRRLSAEAIDLLDVPSDSMDDSDDPDFMLGSDEHHHKTAHTPTKRARRVSSGSSSTCNESQLVPQPPKKVVAPVVQASTPSSGTIITVIKPGFTGLEEANITPPTRNGGTRYICCVKNCTSQGLSNLDGLWLFPVPQDEPTRKLWLEEISVDLGGNRPASPRVCYRHFHDNLFVRHQQRLLGLQKGVLPSRNPKSTSKSNSSKNNVTKIAPATPVTASVPAGTVATQSQTRVSTVSITKGHEMTPLPQVVGRVVRSPAPSSTTPAMPMNGIFINLPLEKAAGDIKVEGEKSQTAAALCETPTNGLASCANNSLSFPNGRGPQECGGDVANDDYELTLADIEEELPCPVRDMPWDSSLDDSELHLVWNNGPDTNTCKKVVLDRERRVSVYVGERQVVLTVQKITDMSSLKQLFTELGKL
ncbi:uncharacterized protein LOC119180350 isoform X1 [Rhipicephalus microplus]|uniref:uncharacterized protein LOC119180350 isoform X1 n=1 Tax=Rhipicephalus microplus TaxID=6941 RepID=UPI003F6C4EDA